MTSTLQRTIRLLALFRLLALVAVLAVASRSQAWAHDLPHESAINSRVTADCFSANNPVLEAAATGQATSAKKRFQFPLVSASLGDLQAYQTLIGKVAEPASAISAAFNRFTQSLWHAQPDSLIVLAPEAAAPPSPKRSRIAANSNPVQRPSTESYMPYDFNVSDFNVSDWRFGQFSNRCLRADFSWSPIVANVEPTASTEYLTEPTDQLLALGAWLEKYESFQCIACNALHNRESFDAFAEYLAARTGKLAERVSLAFAAALTSPTDGSPAIPPFFSEPQFVIYDSHDGQRTILTAAQAKSWEFLVEQKKIAEAKVVRSAILPVQEQTLHAVSYQLESLGNWMLSLSRTVASYAGTNVAHNPVEDLR